MMMTRHKRPTTKEGVIPVRVSFDPRSSAWAFQNFLMDRTTKANLTIPQTKKGVPVYRKEHKLPRG